MSDDHRDSTAQLLRSFRVSLSQVRDTGGKLRDEILGTISLVALLVVIFQIEVLAADASGFMSSKAYLASFSREVKMTISVLAGPFLHRGPGHLIDNIGVLILTGAYLEYQYNKGLLYQFYLLVGYLAGWVPLLFGFTGSVGGSGVTYGLTTWLLIHSFSRVLEMTSEWTLDWRGLHILLTLFGSVKVQPAFTGLLSNAGAGDITHFFGALLGLTIGFLFILDYHSIQLKFW